MRLTIVPSDGAVYKDGKSYAQLDLSCAPENLHALQWYDTYGEIEFKRDFVNGQLFHPQNQFITELPGWVDQALEKWDEALALQIASEEAARLAAEEAARIDEEEKLNSGEAANVPT